MNDDMKIGHKESIKHACKREAQHSLRPPPIISTVFNYATSALPPIPSQMPGSLLTAASFRKLGHDCGGGP